MFLMKYLKVGIIPYNVIFNVKKQNEDLLNIKTHLEDI